MEKNAKRKRTKRKKASSYARNDETLASTKKFLVTDAVSGRTCMIVFHSYENFVRRCRDRFAIEESSDIQFFDATVENAEIDRADFSGLYDGFNVSIKMVDETYVTECCGSDAAPEDNMSLDPQRSYGSIPEGDRYHNGRETLTRVEGKPRNAMDMPRGVSYYDLGMSNTETDEEIVAGKFDRWNLSTNTLDSGFDQTRFSESFSTPTAIGSGNTMAVDNTEITKLIEVEKGTAIRTHIAKFGLKDVDEVLETYLNEWKKKPLTICITGMAGKGKSSLVNALRNMFHSDPGAAEVGEVECTKECKAYWHPELDNVILWDVPGVETESFPKDTYLKDIDADKYDFFIIISSERFTELDIWLAKEIENRKKKFYFIRTKVDVDMDSIEDRKLNNFNEKLEFENLKLRINQDLRDFEGSHMKCFLLSTKSRYRNKYDLPALQQQLKNDVTSKRSDAMLVGTVALSKSVIEEKASVILSRAKNTALVSGTVAAIPIPFLSTGIDIAIILQEISFYRTQFGLEDEYLKKLAASVNESVHTLKSRVRFHTPPSLFTEVGLRGYLSKYLANKTGETLVQYLVPVVGTAFSCITSYGFTLTLLEDIVNMMKADATNVLIFVTNKNDKDIDRMFVRYECKSVFFAKPKT